jgi:Tol biopolymer transport system component/DNA-binding winged helix-turn-helix (wHTH) protein
MSSAVSHFYRFGHFRLDVGEHLLYRLEGQVVPLKPKVVETLELLVQERGRLLSKDELMQRLWPDTVVEESNLTQNIYLLRKVLGTDPNGSNYIETVPKRGYRFTAPVEVDEVNTVGEERIDRASTRPTVALKPTRSRSPVTAIAGAQKIVLAALALVALGIAAILGVRYFLRSSQRVGASLPFQNFRIRRITDSGEIADAAISPDGKSVAYSDIDNSIWIQNLATGDRLRVLPEFQYERRGLVFSPDGNQLYFDVNIRNEKSQKVQLMRVSVLGGQAQRVLDTAFHTVPAISPDGKEFAFIHWFMERGEYSLIISDGTHERTVTTRKTPDFFGLWSKTISWSPDGQHIACVESLSQNNASVWSVVIVKVADGSGIRLPNQGRNWNYVGDVAWLPKGNGLVVTAREDPSANFEIWRVSYPEGEWRKLTNDLSDYDNLGASIEGGRMVTIQTSQFSNLWLLPQADLTRARQITFGNGRRDGSSGLSWTPDGRIVFASDAGGLPQIWIADRDGANLKQLTFGNEPSSQPFVSPDGRYIVFKSYHEQKSHIWRMDLDGSNVMQLTDGSGEAWPVVTADGLDVLYTSYAPPFSSIWSIALSGATPAKQLTFRFPAGQARISPDGKFFAASFYDASSQSPWRIGIYPAAGGDPLTSIDEPLVGLANWSPDGRAITFLDQLSPSIWKQTIGTGKRVKALSLTRPEYIYNFAFSPYDSSLIIARGRPQMDALLIEDVK